MKKLIAILLVLGICIAGYCYAASSSAVYGYSVINVIIDNIPTTIEYAHKKIHDGKFFSASFVNTSAADGDFCNMLVNSTGTAYYSNFMIDVLGTQAGHVVLYESPTVASLGTVWPYANRNRNGTSTSILSIYNSPALLTNGTMLIQGHFGTNKSSGGTRIGEHEWVLKPNTLYLISIESEANTNEITSIFSWYEDDD